MPNTFSEMVPKSVHVSMESGVESKPAPEAPRVVIFFLRTSCLVALLGLSCCTRVFSSCSEQGSWPCGGRPPPRGVSPCGARTPGPQEPWLLGSGTQAG